MRIGIITDAIDDGAAGIGVYVRNLVEQLSVLDKKNKYYLIHHDKDNSFYAKIKNKNFEDNIVPLKKRFFYKAYRKFFLLSKCVNKLDLDIIHETTQIGTFFKNSKIKKVITVYDLVPLILPRTQTLKSYLSHKILLRFITHKYDKIITISKNSQRDISKLLQNQDKIATTYLGSNIIDDSPEEEHKKYFITVGTLEPRKNHCRLIKAFSKFCSKHKDYKLIIIGRKGWKYKPIFSLVKKLKLTKQVRFLHQVNSEQLAKYYKTAEALIYPSLYEGFGIPILEAMNMGCPVIASNTSSMPEIAGDAAILVDPYKIDAIYSAINKVSTSQILRKSLIQKGKQRARFFSWRKCAKETLAIYTKLKNEKTNI